MNQDNGDNLPVAKPCLELEEAWSIFFGDDHSSNKNNMSDDDTFLKKLQFHLPALDDQNLDLAWTSCNYEIKDLALCRMSTSVMKEMVYHALANLIWAAAKGENWEAYTASISMEKVRSSIAFRCKARGDPTCFQTTKILTSADAVVTLVDGCDAFAMLDVQATDPDGVNSFSIEQNKCAIATTATAHVVSQCIDKEHYADVALPFCIARGPICSLYVTTLNDEGVPCIKVVGFPDGGNGKDNDFLPAPSLTRKKYFVALAVLLNKFKGLFQTHGRQRYKELFCKQIQPSDPMPIMYVQDHDTSKPDGGESNDEHGRNVRPGWLLEQAAVEAATCGGMFSNVEYAMERFLRVSEVGLKWDDQTETPFYFRGRATSDSGDMATKDLFIKVWDSNRRSFEEVESERLHHRLAFDAGIPVAYPVLGEIVRSTSFNGTEYFVFVTEYLEEDPITTVVELLQYSISLIETVLKLHNQAVMLHCSLKPANVRWNHGVVKLIDFEQAQKIDGAIWHPGPSDFMSPEVVRNKPCSRKSDAYSVGKTMEVLLHKLEYKYQVDIEQDEISLVLYETARQLLRVHPHSRWSLQAALEHIKNKTTHLDLAWISRNGSADSMMESTTYNQTMRSDCSNGVLSNFDSLHHTSVIAMKQFPTENLHVQGINPGNTITTAPPCRELKKAWSLLDEDFERMSFVDKLRSRLPSLNRSLVKNAWLACFFEYDLELSDRVTERTLQDLVYLPFIQLMIAAAGGSGRCHPCYRSQQEVFTSSRVFFKRESDKPGYQPSKVVIKPDAAVTLAPGWDAFAMLLIHVDCPDNDQTNTVDKDKPTHDFSPWMTKLTAELLRPCIHQARRDELALPFLIITENVCSLYVTTLDIKGKARIQLVGYPDGGNAMKIDLSKSPSKARQKLFLTFGVLLNKFRKFFEANCRERYETMLQERLHYEFANDLPIVYLSGKNIEGINEIDGSLEKAAQEAAACDGMFTHVTYLIERRHDFIDHRVGCNKLITSPYFFAGCPTSAAVGIPTKVFLKVWKAAAVAFDDVESEFMFHKRAFDAGVPVAIPVLEKIIMSRSSCGTEHFVFVTEYLDDEKVETVMDAFQYAASLMETILQLHKEVGMLHCSLKPENVRWNSGVIKLIDFEMAQNIVDARWKPGPHDFMAPEVLKKLPCSIKTDAYSVGKTILSKLNRVSNTLNRLEADIWTILRRPAAKLTENDPDERWCVEQALAQLEISTMHLVPRVWKKLTEEST